MINEKIPKKTKTTTKIFCSKVGNNVRKTLFFIDVYNDKEKLVLAYVLDLVLK